MDAVETDLMCGGLSLGDVGDGFSSFLNWADDVLDQTTDSHQAFGQSGASKRCFLRLDIGPADMLQADCLPVMMEREPCFTEGDVLVAPSEAAPGAQWRSALDGADTGEYSVGPPDVPDISAKYSRHGNADTFEAPTSSDSGGNAVEMTTENGRRSARRRVPTTIWPEENAAPLKRQRRKEDDLDYNAPLGRRPMAPSSPSASPTFEGEETEEAYRHKFAQLSKATSQRSESKPRSPSGSPVKPEVPQESITIREDEEEDWKPPSDRTQTERPRPPVRKPVEVPEGHPVVRAGGVFKTAALNVLRAERRLLSTGEITRVALRLGFLGSLPGKTPEATMASALYTDIKKGKGRNGAGSIFCRPAEGSFGLREWSADPELAHVLDPTSRGPTPRSQRSNQSASSRRGGAQDAPNGMINGPGPAGHVNASHMVAAHVSVGGGKQMGAGPDARLGNGGQGRVLPCNVINDYNGKKQGSAAAAAC